ncbi:Outer membrane protein assembly factor BamB, contains PQQ-like beta-propeller repeat [Salinihabitans flavidus]|uniref:Outer membrane protein assembly factor BamB, contains PQQ-like beta-propeller repeat n=1 Tax=Salinihabitans flavidus TaxID=569882 RepID=A0A1H8NGD0_9RHOB|nr:PQQ-like beta-propeller repeat protein [Salinihabitans flavidus]SEO28637.1 Outer membrane protein assembly factor BamB, contains PQQ-like beta-propeller repeat [Salinihabitans flavidus]
MLNHNWILALTGAVLIAGCTEPQFILPGEREELRSGEAATAQGEIVNRAAPIRLAQQSVNANWTHRIGTPAFRTTHPALSQTPKLKWSADVGSGMGKRQRLNTDPIVADGRIFTLDSESQLVATSTSGEQVWFRDMTPPQDRRGEATSGGFSYGDGRLYVVTGFGVLMALSPATGDVIWEQKLLAVGNSTPTFYKGRVYVVAGDETAWAVDAATGRVDWRLGALPSVASLQAPTAPALTDRLAIFGFGSGEMNAVFREGGTRLWNVSITGQRPGRAINTVGDISGDPVIDGGTLYAANHTGRLVAMDLDTGQRKWTIERGTLSPVWPAGGSLFMVTERNKLVRINASDGEVIWEQELPLFVQDRPRRMKSMHEHYGPVIAGGRVIVASSDGRLRSYDPESGALLYDTPIPDGAASNPIVAGRTLYVLGAEGQLHAFR